MSYTKEFSFGLDIGDRSLKVLQLTQHKKRTRLEAFSELAIPEGIVTNGDIQKPDELASYIKQIVSKAKISSINVVAALPETKSFLKLLNIPIEKDVDTAILVERELTMHLPYEIDSVWWDFFIAGQNDISLQVLAGAAPKLTVSSYSSVLEKAGLTPVALDIESLAIARAAMSSEMHNSAMIIDLGATKSTMIIATPITVISTADAKTSGDSLTTKIAAALKTDQHAAEEMKYKYGLEGPPNEYNKVLEDYVSLLTTRIKEMFSFTLNHEISAPPITQILLSGGGSLLKGLSEKLTNTLKIPVKHLDPWVNTKDKIGARLGAETSMRFTTAAGLALASLQQIHGV